MTLPAAARALGAAAILLSLPLGSAVAADPVPQNDLLNATAWMRAAVEYRANCLAVYSLAKIRLDEALADKNWTAYEQTGAYQALPPAVILDLDETALDNSAFEAGLVSSRTPFNQKSWEHWVEAASAAAVPGAVDFADYAASKSVKVFYVTNRTAAHKAATRRNLEALGFPLGGNVETLLMRNDRPEWSSPAKGARFASIATHYRVLLLLGDNFGDFTDRYSGSVAERQQVFEALKPHFGHDWIVLANPIYGSWESAAYGHDFKLPAEAKRRSKIDALSPWPTP